MKLYGNLTNRLLEGKNYTGRDLQVDDDITMYHYSDRTCYYITKVINQKHIFVREYKVERNPDSEPMSNDWLYFKDETKNEEEWVFRNNSWKEVSKWNIEKIEQMRERTKWLRYPMDFTDKDVEKVNSGKEVNKYHKLSPISFGTRDYHYDYEF